MRIKDEQGLISALQKRLANAAADKVNYNVDDYVKRGVSTDTVEGLLRIFMVDRNDHMFEHRVDNGKEIYLNAFNCCYGWETVLQDMLSDIAPFLEDGSRMYFGVENDNYILYIRDGKVSDK